MFSGSKIMELCVKLHCESLYPDLEINQKIRLTNCKAIFHLSYRAVQNALTILIIFRNALRVKRIMRLFSVSVDCFIETKKII